MDTQDEVYFHRNSVLHDDFDRLTIGMGVRYVAEDGEKGLAGDVRADRGHAPNADGGALSRMKDREREAVARLVSSAVASGAVSTTDA